MDTHPKNATSIGRLVVFSRERRPAPWASTVRMRCLRTTVPRTMAGSRWPLDQLVEVGGQEAYRARDAQM